MSSQECFMFLYCISRNTSWTCTCWQSWRQSRSRSRPLTWNGRQQTSGRQESLKELYAYFTEFDRNLYWDHGPRHIKVRPSPTFDSKIRVAFSIIFLSEVSYQYLPLALVKNMTRARALFLNVTYIYISF